MQWTDQRKEFLFYQRRRGRSFAEAAQNMSDFFHEEITTEEIEQLWNEMLRAGWVKNRRARERKSLHPFAGEDPAAEKKRLIHANILHLIDLKRAGHSPKRTEYIITAEGKGVRYRMADTSSYIGSSAAACAAEV